MAKGKKSFPVIRVLIICLIFSVLFNLLLLRQKSEQNRVKRVVDGDSFDLADGRRIRLLGIDAPDRGRCLYQEARSRLSQLVANKKVRLTDVVIDDYGRILANVFVGKTLTNQVMVEEALAKFSYVSSPQYQKLKQSAAIAKGNKIGIYSPLCQNTVSKTDCQIKGNLRAGEKVYHLPDCKNYHQVIIDEAFGDQWFCTETEAQTQGFRKATGCK